MMTILQKATNPNSAFIIGSNYAYPTFDIIKKCIKHLVLLPSEFIIMSRLCI